MAATTNTILIAEPHEACRRFIGHLIARTKPNLEVIATTARPDDAAVLVTSLRPDVVVLWTDGDQYGCVAGIKDAWANARVVVLADHGDGAAVFEAMRGGATAFVPESAEPEAIVDAIDRASRGESTVDGALVTQAIHWAATQVDEAATEIPLTTREAEVLDLLVTGIPVGAIAATLYVSRRTVESHLLHAYRKLGVRGRIEALRAYGLYGRHRPQRALERRTS